MTKLPKSDLEAAKRLENVLDLSAKEIRSLGHGEFLSAWYAVFFLYLWLHPDETDHGEERWSDTDNDYIAGEIDERLRNPCYSISGWPVALTPLLAEAWRRHGEGLLKDTQMYPVCAQHAGVEHRSK